MASKTRKEQVMDMALSLMRQRSYQGTSMRDIAQEMKMEAASLYNHISSKEEILQNTCFNLADKFITAISEVNDIYFNSVDKLKKSIRSHISILTENSDASFVFIHEWRNLSDPYKSEFLRLRNKYENGLLKILEEGEKEGVFNEVNNKFAMLTILSSLNWIVEWYNPEGEMSPTEIADKLSEFILTGLKK